MDKKGIVIVVVFIFLVAAAFWYFGTRPMSVTSSTPPGLKAIWRAWGTSAKTAIWKSGGTFNRARSSFSACVQESSSKGNNAEIQSRTRLARKGHTRTGQARMGIFSPRTAFWLFSEGTAAVVTGLLQLFALIFCSHHTRSFYTRFRQNYPERALFRSRP